jgi:hypothetical protein
MSGWANAANKAGEIFTSFFIAGSLPEPLPMGSNSWKSRSIKFRSHLWTSDSLPDKSTDRVLYIVAIWGLNGSLALH